MNKKTTHYEKVLRWLNEYGSITQLQAFEQFACFRLSAVIFLLRKDGYNIESETMTGKNRFGENTHFTRYVFKGE